jgi:hypothetical protein
MKGGGGGGPWSKPLSAGRGGQASANQIHTISCDPFLELL